MSGHIGQKHGLPPVAAGREPPPQRSRGLEGGPQHVGSGGRKHKPDTQCDQERSPECLQEHAPVIDPEKWKEMWTEGWLKELVSRQRCHHPQSILEHQL